MICLGNICRSPLAQGIMEAKAKAAGLHWLIDSAGTGGWHVGEKPHRLSQKVALHHGIHIGHQRARKFVPEDAERFDVLLFMDRSNLEDARAMAGPKWDETRAFLLMHWLPLAAHPDIPDPYYGGEEGFFEVFHLISEACDAFISQQLSKADGK